MKRTLPEFEFKQEKENYGNRYEFHAVLKDPEKFPWIKEKKWIWSGDESKIPEAQIRFKEFADSWKRQFVNPEDYKNLWEKVDATKINQAIMSMLKLSIKFNPKFEKVTSFDTHHNVDRFELASEVNLAPSNPILLSAWREFRISSWSSWCQVNEDGSIYISMTLNFSYSHQRGGSNGAEFARIKISEKEITIEDIHEKAIRWFPING